MAAGVHTSHAETREDLSHRLSEIHRMAAKASRTEAVRQRQRAALLSLIARAMEDLGFSQSELLAARRELAPRRR